MTSEIQLTKAQRHEIFQQTDEAHQQVRPGVCSCGRETFSKGRHSRDMWKTHRIYEEVKAQRAASGLPPLQPRS